MHSVLQLVCTHVRMAVYASFPFGYMVSQPVEQAASMHAWAHCRRDWQSGLPVQSWIAVAQFVIAQAPQA